MGVARDGEREEREEEREKVAYTRIDKGRGTERSAVREENMPSIQIEGEGEQAERATQDGKVCGVVSAWNRCRIYCTQMRVSKLFTPPIRS